MDCGIYQSTLQKEAKKSSEMLIKDDIYGVTNQMTTIETTYFVRRLLLQNQLTDFHQTWQAVRPKKPSAAQTRDLQLAVSEPAHADPLPRNSIRTKQEGAGEEWEG
jgi:hypothetical protein